MKKAHASRHGHHLENPKHDKHHGHKEAHRHHEKMRHEKLEHQAMHGRNMHVHAEGKDYSDLYNHSNDNHQQGMSRKIVPENEKEVGQGGKMHWSPDHKAEFLRHGNTMTPRKG